MARSGLLLQDPLHLRRLRQAPGLHEKEVQERKHSGLMAVSAVRKDKLVNSGFRKNKLVWSSHFSTQELMMLTSLVVQVLIFLFFTLYFLQF